MKIATWNIARLKHKNRIHEIIAACIQCNADILVLTEADERIHLPAYSYPYATALPQAHELPPYAEPVWYASTERRVMVYTKYPCINQHATYDEHTAICLELETERGNLLVYGSIIGIYGHRKPYFMNDLHGQIADIYRLALAGHKICFLGDYNCSFADNYYPSSVGKNAILTCFSKTKIRLLTEWQPECIDHIAISDSFISNAATTIEEWNFDKKLSDHKGIAVRF